MLNNFQLNEGCPYFHLSSLRVELCKEFNVTLELILVFDLCVLYNLSSLIHQNLKFFNVVGRGVKRKLLSTKYNMI